MYCRLRRVDKNILNQLDKDMSQTQKVVYCRWRSLWEQWKQLPGVIRLRDDFQPYRCAVITCSRSTGLWIPWYDPDDDRVDDAPQSASVQGSTRIAEYIWNYKFRMGELVSCKFALGSNSVDVVCVTCSSRCYKFAAETLEPFMTNPLIIRGTSHHRHGFI